MEFAEYMRIVICDDTYEEAQFYEKLCRKLGETYGIFVELKLYVSSEELLFDLESAEFRKKLDVIFFSLHEKNLEMPKQIREAGYAGLIIFIGGAEMLMTYEQLFDTETYNFIQRSRMPEHIERFAHIFQNAAKMVAKNHVEKLVLSYGGEIRQIDLNEVHYFEVQKYALIVHYGAGETFTFISSLAKMEHHLKGRDFVRASRFYLISLKAIKEVKSGTVVMQDGVTISVGRKYYAEIKAAMGVRE